MDSIFWLKVAVSFFVAGVAITTATVLAEKFGTKIGGLLANLPSNILVSLIFIALTRDSLFAAETTRATPIGMSINTLFLFVFIVVLRWGVTTAAVTSLATWFILIFLAGQFPLTDWNISLPVYIITAIISFLILEYGFKIPAVAKNVRRFSLGQLTIRAVFAGSVVALTVVVASLTGPYWTGLVASFPSVLFSTMMILSLTQSPAFAQATGKVMIFSSSNIVIYALTVHYTYPTLGITIGTAIAFASAFVWVWGFHPLLRKIQ